MERRVALVFLMILSPVTGVGCFLITLYIIRAVNLRGDDKRPVGLMGVCLMVPGFRAACKLMYQSDPTSTGLKPITFVTGLWVGVSTF
jgi:hypothetical protein